MMPGPGMSQTAQLPVAAEGDAADGGVVAGPVPRAAADPPRLPRPILVRPAVGKNPPPPLFYFGGAIAAPEAFAAVVNELRPGPAVYVCCFPGNGGPADGNWAHRSVASLAAELVEEIRRIQPDGSYLLCGYSLGARVVFEAGRQIRQAGEPVGLLALLDGWAPGYPVRYSARRRALIHLRNLLRGRGALGYLKGRFANVRNRLTRRAARKTAALNIVKGDASPPSGPLADLGLVAALHHRPAVYEGDIVLVRADVTPDWPGSCFDDATNGWKTFVRGSIDVRHVRCRHLELLSPPAATRVAEVLDNCMAKAL